MGNYADLLKAQHQTKAADNLGTKEPRKPAAKEAGNLGSKEPVTQGFQEARKLETLEERKQGITRPLSMPASREDRFDLNEVATKDATFQFAERELDALDMLCLELKRELGEKPKKYDIIRAGLQHMIEDYHQQGEKSVLIARLRKRK